MPPLSAAPATAGWPTPQIVSAPGNAPLAFTLVRIDVPAALDARADIWLPELVATARLHAEEAALVGAMPPARRATFVAGRLAMRAALSAHAPLEAHGPILRSDRGAPVLPPSVAGSVSHKHDAALALVSPRRAMASGTSVHVGVDLEHRPNARDIERPSIARRILTASELDALSVFDSDPLAQRERVILSFAIKEAVYKAIDPTVQRYVRFTEVALRFTDAGAVHVTLLLPELQQGELRVEAQYRIEDRWIVATALATVPDELAQLR
jgi:enterobactin synthetase component D